MYIPDPATAPGSLLPLVLLNEKLVRPAAGEPPLTDVSPFSPLARLIPISYDLYSYYKKHA